MFVPNKLRLAAREAVQATLPRLEEAQ